MPLNHKSELPIFNCPRDSYSYTNYIKKRPESKEQKKNEEEEEDHIMHVHI